MRPRLLVVVSTLLITMSVLPTTLAMQATPGPRETRGATSSGRCPVQRISPAALVAVLGATTPEDVDLAAARGEPLPPAERSIIAGSEITSGKRGLFALDAATGVLRWRVDLGSAQGTHAGTAANADTVFVTE
jgi:hypothetical protein